MSPNTSAKPPKPCPPGPPPAAFGSTPAWPNRSYASRLEASESISYASFASLNFSSAALSFGLRSGWCFMASLRYAFLMSSSDAFF